MWHQLWVNNKLSLIIIGALLLAVLLTWRAWRRRQRPVSVMGMPDQITGTLQFGQPAEPLIPLGRAGEGTAFRATNVPQWAVYSRGALNRHGVILGESGKGKTEFVLRLAYGAAKAFGWRVYVLDCKGSPQFATQFYAVMQRAGVPVSQIGMFPYTSFDAWRGSAELIYNKLVAALEYSEPFYKQTAETAVRLALFAEREPPRSTHAFLQRFDLGYLVKCYQGDVVSLRRLKSIKEEHLKSAYMRFDALFASLGPAFDGTWAWEDMQAGYFLLDAVSMREQARTAGRYLIEDFAQAIKQRIPPGEFALLIIDEYPAIAGAGEAAKLFEQVRSPNGNGGAGIFVTAQSYAGLGEDADRMIQAANATIAFQQADTERIVLRAGQQLIRRRAYSGQQGERLSPMPNQSQPIQTQAAQMPNVTHREEVDFALSPDAVRRLSIGECYLIPSGAYQKVTIERVPVTDSELAAAAQALGALSDAEKIHSMREVLQIEEEPAGTIAITHVEDQQPSLAEVPTIQDVVAQVEVRYEEAEQAAKRDTTPDVMPPDDEVQF